VVVVGLNQAVPDVSDNVVIVGVHLLSLLEISDGVLRLLNVNQRPPEQFVVLVSRIGLRLLTYLYEFNVALGEVPAVLEVLQVNVGHLFAALSEHGVVHIHGFQDVYGLFDVASVNHDLGVRHQHGDLVVRPRPLADRIVYQLFGLLCPIDFRVSLGKG